MKVQEPLNLRSIAEDFRTHAESKCGKYLMLQDYFTYNDDYLSGYRDACRLCADTLDLIANDHEKNPN